MTLIATWNVNSIRTRLTHAVAWLKARSPDIVLVQEIKCREPDFPFTEIEDLGYNIRILGQKSYNGVAIFAKSPIDEIQEGLPTFQADSQSRYLEAQIGSLRVASIYVPNGQSVGSEKFSYKMEFLEALYAHAQALFAQEMPLILGGDYNIAPYVCDGYSRARFEEERILCSLQERMQLRRLFNLGYLDGVRLKYPATLKDNQEIYTWWDYRAGSYENNVGYRIDHLLLSPQAADLYKDAGVDHDIRGHHKPSDHAPVWIKLKAGSCSQ